MKTILSLSGGIDSCVLVPNLLQKGHIIQPVSFYYGSKHNIYENQAARDIVDFYKEKIHPLMEINISGITTAFKSNLLQTGSQIPEGHYAQENMKSTVVPARNMIFLSILTGIALSLDFNSVAAGMHAGDHYIYPDCRPAFVTSINSTIMEASDEKVCLLAPFTKMDKANIVELGLKNEAPLHLTRTCYKNQEKACGKCGACIERLEAFQKNSTLDPISYFGG